MNENYKKAICSCGCDKWNVYITDNVAFDVFLYCVKCGKEYFQPTD